MSGQAHRRPLRVIIFNDSATMRRALHKLIQSDGDFKVVAAYADARDAGRAVLDETPDLVIMDVVMPGVDGFAATRTIMRTRPTPVVLVSGQIDSADATNVLEALSSGAVCITQAPPYEGEDGAGLQGRAFVELLRTMAGARSRPAVGRPKRISEAPPEPVEWASGVEAIGIVASTGGPAAVAEVLSGLPPTAPSVFIVQHIVDGFAKSFADWLTLRIGRSVVVAERGAPLTLGKIYVAPDDIHLGVSLDGRVALSKVPPIGGFRPSGTFLLESLAACFKRRAIGLLLTGMGRDGVDGAHELHRAGATVLCQNEASSVIFGIAKRAIDEGVGVLTPLEDIANEVVLTLERKTSTP